MPDGLASFPFAAGEGTSQNAAGNLGLNAGMRVRSEPLSRRKVRVPSSRGWIAAQLQVGEASQDLAMPGVRQQPRVATAGPCAAADTGCSADLRFMCLLSSYLALFPIIKVS